ncbi:unnamed protein product [Amoebophrya sp. A120]|nr:unnamed protein product [Amoebophrya sp. A120]|eukprot:GSA120T00012217001.1
MLPLHLEDREPPDFGGSRNLTEYLKMALRYAQLDIEYTFAQMWYILANPRKVYQLTSYRKQTKNHWSRDDPAFVVLTVLFLFVASVAYALAFRANLFRVLFYTIGVHYVLLGLAIASAYTYVCNNHLRERGYSHHGSMGGHYVRQELEWQYAWDVHCNGFIHVLLMVYVLQFLLLPILYDDQGIGSLLDEAQELAATGTASAVAGGAAAAGVSNSPDAAAAASSPDLAAAGIGAPAAASGGTGATLRVLSAASSSAVQAAAGSAMVVAQNYFKTGDGGASRSSSSSVQSSSAREAPLSSGDRSTLQSESGAGIEPGTDYLVDSEGGIPREVGESAATTKDVAAASSRAGVGSFATIAASIRNRIYPEERISRPRRRLQEGAASSGGTVLVDARSDAAAHFDPTKIRSPSLTSCFLSNLLFGCSLLAYFYVTSMGYAMLPFLEKTEVLLYPCILLALLIVLCVFLRINLTVWFVWMICG